MNESKYDDNYLELKKLIDKSTKFLYNKTLQNTKNIVDIQNDLVKLEQQKKLNYYKSEIKQQTGYNMPQGGRRKGRRKSPGKKKRKSPKKRRKSPKKRRNSQSNSDSPPQPKVGDYILIIIKPYFNNVTVKGQVKRVLTRRKYHSRGHKVELINGTIGRTVKILKKI